MDAKQTVQIVVGKRALHRLIIASNFDRRTTPANATWDEQGRAHRVATMRPWSDQAKFFLSLRQALFVPELGAASASLPGSAGGTVH